MSRYLPDPAAVLGIAMSLHEAGATGDHGDVSESCKGADQFMRECMHVAEKFEAWACRVVDFDGLDDVWPYMLRDKFGEVFFKHYSLFDMSTFGEDQCAPLALDLEIPTINLDIYHQICHTGRLVNHAEEHWGWAITDPQQMQVDHPTPEEQLRYPRDRLDMLGGPAWTSAWFAIEDGPVFLGFHNGSTWNGWAKPYFSRAVADQLVEWLNYNSPSEKASHYDKSLRSYVIKAQDDQEDEVVEELIDPKLPKGFFGIGAGSWIWDTIEDDDILDRRRCDGNPKHVG